MNAQLTSGSEIPELRYHDGKLVHVTIEEGYYMVNDRYFEKSILTNGKRKRMIAEYQDPVALYYWRPSSSTPHTVISVVDGEGNGDPNQLWSIESINGLISFYTVRSDLLKELILKLDGRKHT